MESLVPAVGTGSPSGSVYTNNFQQDSPSFPALNPGLSSSNLGKVFFSFHCGEFYKLENKANQIMLFSQKLINNLFLKNYLKFVYYIVTEFINKNVIHWIYLCFSSQSIRPLKDRYWMYTMQHLKLYQHAEPFNFASPCAHLATWHLTPTSILPSSYSC